MNGIDRIATERKRQIDVKGFDALRDEGYHHGELAAVAAALITYGGPTDHQPIYDPWDIIGKHKDDPVQLLVIAGALIAAEIDRLEH